MKAFLLAAGFGTRLKPFTNEHPKALADVNGKSLLERNILYLQRWGVEEVVVNVHHFAEQIIQTLQEHKGFGSRVLISDESDAVLETGGGLKRAAPLLQDSEPFLMMNVDVLCDFDVHRMLQAHQQTHALATLAVQKRPSSRALLFDRGGQLSGWTNFKTGERRIVRPVVQEQLTAFAFSGIQMLSQSFLTKMRREGKFSIIESYLDLCPAETISAWEHTGDAWLDVGRPESLEQARRLFQD